MFIFDFAWPPGCCARYQRTIEVVKGHFNFSGQLKKARCQHSMVAVGSSLFCLGGSNLLCRELKSALFKTGKPPQVTGAIEEYHVGSKRWKVVAELTFPVFSAAATVSGEQILIFGGLGKDFLPTSCVQCFHVRLKECTVISNLPKPFRRLIATKIDDNIYVTSNEDDESSVFKLTPDFGFTDAGFDIPTENGILGITHYDRHFVVLTGSPEDSNCLGNIVKVNLKNSKPEILEVNGVSGPKGVHASYRCFIDKRFLYHTYFQ